MKKSNYLVGRRGGQLLLTLGVLSLFALLFLTLIVSGASQAQAGGLPTAKLTIDPQFSDYPVSNLGGGSPDIEVSGDGSFVAMVYYKVSSTAGGIHIKSSSSTDGWVTTRYLGSGQNPSVTFHNSTNNRTFVVWGSGDNKAIKFADCTLNPTTSPTCTTRDVTTVGSGTVETPDIVMDSGGNLHVVWVQDTDIKTASSGDNGVTWSTTSSTPIPSSGGTNDFRSPQLAVTTVLHLAFNRTKPAANPNDPRVGDAVIYYRDVAPLDGNHNWVGIKTFASPGQVNGQYDDLANPTLAAVGNNVYLAWDGHIQTVPANNYFGLMQTTSADNGSSWTIPKHVIENTNAQLNVQNPIKFSQKAVTVPPQETALRPSMTISGSGYALVWQERKDEGCGEGQNNSSEIRFAYTNTTWIDSNDRLADNGAEYSIDPDLAVSSGGARHFVFMKDPSATVCDGGEAAEYQITYRGPFTITTNDKGEDPTDPSNGPPTVYLPLISKS